ncbi:MAG: hypothetical protein HC802_07380 [Caldilineaceae bacterium]|nr:hypothetical protein [Caldilineaceae bacterium]
MFLDVKSADISALIELVYTLGLEDDCFFWFGNADDARRFRELDNKLALKVNVHSVEDVLAAAKELAANIVEVSLHDMSQEIVDACRRWGIKIMVYHQRKRRTHFARFWNGVWRWSI